MRKVLVLIFLMISQAQANVIGSDAQNFNPTTNGIDFVTVQSSETLEPGVFNLGIFINHAVNTLPYFPAPTGSVSQSRTEFNDSMTSSDLNFGLGLAKNWDVGISFPYVIRSKADNTNNLGIYSDGLTEIRLNTKYKFYGDSKGGWAAVLTQNFNQIQNNPFAGSGAGPSTSLEFVYDTTFNNWQLGANAGYRWRRPGAPIAGLNLDPVGDSYLASVAASYLLTDIDTKLIFEIFTSTAATRTGTNQTDRDLSSRELIAGVKHDINTNLAVHAGGGTELEHGNSSPDWRIYAGLNYTFGPLWRKQSELVKVKPAQAPQFEEIELPGLNFITGTAELAGNSKDTLDRLDLILADILSSRKDVKKIVIEGHTDSVGSNQYNQKLSELRAQAIRNHIRQNVKLGKVTVEAIGYGELRPIADNGNYQGRSQNRRVEVKLY
jgi:outer membrane protein OmpA-like peptidoglycan-associated protein